MTKRIDRNIITEGEADCLTFRQLTFLGDTVDVQLHDPDTLFGEGRIVTLAEYRKIRLERNRAETAYPKPKG
jgi:hypothetical protein